MGRHHALKPHHLYLPPSSHPASTNLLHLSKPSYPFSPAFFQSSSISALSVRDRIPGLKVSAAFLSSLQSNIFIELDSSFDSPENSPYSLRPQAYNLPPSPLVHSMSSLTDADVSPPAALKLPDHAIEHEKEAEDKEPTVGEDGIPLLKTFPAKDDDMRAEALHIVADTVAQQRNIGSRALIYHPASAAVLVAAFALLRQLYYRGNGADYIMIFTTFIGVIMALGGAIRLLLGPYIFEAERVGTWKWLNTGRSAEEEEESGFRVLGDTDEILVTKFGDDYIGAIIFRAVQPVHTSASPNSNKKTRRAQSPSKHTKMVIRAWSVAQKYRRKEIGSALLEDAIKLGKEKGWTADGIEFAKDHANSKRVLPAMLNGALDRFDRIAQKTLEKKTQELEALEKGRKRK